MPGLARIDGIKLKQLITPKPCPRRGKPFPLSGNEEWFIYPHGKAVYLYNLKDHSLNKEYREHAYTVGVAKLSPSGTFVASGDQAGNLHIFTLDDNLMTKLEIRALAGRINDLCWSEDEKFIGVSGEGREQFANVIKVDGGASFGELTGPAKASSSISLTSTHCFLASDDKSLTIYQAAPIFKFVKSVKDHEGFVQVVKVSRDGKMVATGGADGKVFIYASETHEVLLNGLKLHDAGILALEWCNNTNFLTASADKTVKLWTLRGQLLCSSTALPGWTFEKQICGLQVYGNDKVIVLRLDGGMEVRRQDTLEIDNGPIVFGSIGHPKGIVDFFRGSGLFSLSYDGMIKSWSQSGTIKSLKEASFNTPIQKLISSQIGVFEDKLKGLNEVEIKSFGNSKIVGFQGESKIVLSDGRIITDNKPILLPFDNIEMTTFSSNLMAISTGTELKIISISGLTEIYSESMPSKITAMSFNSEGDFLAVADDQRRIKVYAKREEDGNVFRRQPTQWCNHSARIDAIYWMNGLILSAGVDGYIMAWSLDHSKTGPMAVVRNAHSGPINCITAGDEANVFISGGADSCIKVWEVQG